MYYQKIAAIIFALTCAACKNTGGFNTEQSVDSKAQKKISSKLDQIERAFERGDDKTACKLQISISNDPSIYTKISPELLKEVKKFQVKCGKRSLSVDLLK